MMTLIKGGHIVNEGRVTKADIIIEDGKIAELSSQNSPITSSVSQDLLRRLT